MKTYLADTHTLLWWTAGRSKKLGKAARRVLSGFARGAVDLRVSVLSLWEVARLHEAGRISFERGYREWCASLDRAGVRDEPLLSTDVEEARNLPALVDPFDRLIAGTALRLGCSLITCDTRIRAASRVVTVWE